MLDEIADARRRIRAVADRIRGRAPIIDFPRDRAASSDIRTGYVDGSPVRRLVITLRGPGCGWVGRGGGCLMCGHHAGTLRGVKPSPSDFLSQFRSETAKYDLDDVAVISIYNSGSMLNPEEIDPDAVMAMFRDVRGMSSVRKVVLESRAEHVDGRLVSKLADALGEEQSLTVAMGLETADDLVRDLCVNKGANTDDIARAVDAVGGVARTQLYVLLGLPFLTEAEALDDTVAALRRAHTLGADEIHIEPMTRQKHTLVDALMASGLYRLPSLYTLYEALRAVLPAIRPYVSPFLHMPLPESIPQGCPDCTDRLVSTIIDVYNISRDVSALDHEPCVCQDDWRERLRKRDPRPLERRIGEALDMLEERWPA